MIDLVLAFMIFGPLFGPSLIAIWIERTTDREAEFRRYMEGLHAELEEERRQWRNRRTPQ